MMEIGNGGGVGNCPDRGCVNIFVVVNVDK